MQDREAILKKMTSMVFKSIKWIFLGMFYYFPLWPSLLWKKVYEKSAKGEWYGDDTALGLLITILDVIVVGVVLLMLIPHEILHWGEASWLLGGVYLICRVLYSLFTVLYYEAKEAYLLAG